MFATILRRWRLVTPLALAVLTISVVAGGMIMPASAHNQKFHFFGRAFALADDSTVLPDTACDTGFIVKVGSASLDTGHCFGVDGQGEPGAAITGSGRLESIFSDATVVSTHGNTKGHVLAKVDMEEAAGAHARNLQGCQAFFFPVGITRTETSCGGFIVLPNGQCTFGDTAITATAVTNAHRVTTTGTTTFPCPAHPAFSLLDDSFGVQQVGDAIFWADLITVAAEAECHVRLNGTSHASVASAIELSDAAVREDNRLRYIGPQGSVGNAGLANTTFTISGFTIHEHPIQSILVILNEQHRFEDGNFAGISVNAVHLIATDDDGFVRFNFILGHAFAGIHCARHLDGQDTLTIPGA
jgi:hypothetical protein